MLEDNPTATAFVSLLLRILKPQRLLETPFAIRPTFGAPTNGLPDIGKLAASATTPCRQRHRSADSFSATLELVATHKLVSRPVDRQTGVPQRRALHRATGLLAACSFV